MSRTEHSEAVPMKSILLRPTRLVGIVLALALIAALGTLSLFTWLDFARIESIRSHVNRTSLLQDSLLRLKDLKDGAIDPGKLRAVRTNLSQVPVKGAPVGTYMRDHL
jgi:hypothetical protein